MADKEKKLTKELQKCRENIQRTKELIAYHRDILRKQERKADELSAKLDKEKMKSLLGMIHQGGLNIDNLRQAVSSGSLTGLPANPAEAANNPKSKPDQTKEDKTHENENDD